MCRILVVDDNIGRSRLTTGILRDRGYRADRVDFTAGTIPVESCVEALKSKRYDILILDVHFGDGRKHSMGGLILYRKLLRQSIHWRETIVYTQYSSNNTENPIDDAQEAILAFIKKEGIPPERVISNFAMGGVSRLQSMVAELCEKYHGAMTKDESGE